MDLLTVKDVSKSFAGNQAIKSLSMTLPNGKIIGLLGPNGSGKTTLMKMIAGLLTPDTGEIIYPSGAKRGIKSKELIAFLPDRISFPKWMNVSDAFEYFRTMYPDYNSERAATMQELLELSPKMVIKRLSKGMQERLATALLFSRKSSIYLLDEPLGGIDPVGRFKVLQSIISSHAQDSSILLSTHLIKDVEAVLDSVLFLKNGKIVFEGDSEALRSQSGKKLEDVYLEVFSGAF